MHFGRPLFFSASALFLKLTIVSLFVRSRLQRSKQHLVCRTGNCFPRFHEQTSHAHVRGGGSSDTPGAQIPAEEFLVMPVWTPGSYLVREFARHVQDFRREDASGVPSWEKTNKNTWRIVTGGAREWRASYRVYANELSVRTNQLNSDHAFGTTPRS